MGTRRPDKKGESLPRWRGEAGGTQVELPVLVAIFGIFFRLLLSAVQTAREAARRMKCANNNLKQMEIGTIKRGETLSL